MSMDLDATAVAYHEAGHVLVAHLLGGEVLITTVESDRDDHAGHTSVAWRDRSAEELARCSALVAMAGPVAEALWRGEDVYDADLSAWRADHDEVERALAALAEPAERASLRQRLLLEVATQLQDPAAWQGLCCIADALDAHGTLDAALLQELLA